MINHSISQCAIPQEPASPKLFPSGAERADLRWSRQKEMPKAASSNNLNLAGDSWDSKGKGNLAAAAPRHCQARKSREWVGKNGPIWGKMVPFKENIKSLSNKFHFMPSYANLPLPRHSQPQPALGCSWQVPRVSQPGWLHPMGRQSHTPPQRPGMGENTKLGEVSDLEEVSRIPILIVKRLFSTESKSQNCCASTRY